MSEDCGRKAARWCYVFQGGKGLRERDVRLIGSRRLTLTPSDSSSIALLHTLTYTTVMCDTRSHLISIITIRGICVSPCTCSEMKDREAAN